jgi:CubicO group peptidase (beta-lactamase class C family)
VYLDNEYQPVPYMDLDIVSGAGSVISNVNDYTKWLQCLLSSSLPISPAGHAALKTPHSFIPSEPDAPWTGVQSYTLGWWTGVYKGHEYFEHSGGMEAFGAQLIFFPKLNYGLVTFGNTAMSSNALGTKLIWHLVDEKLGIPKEERYPWDARYAFFPAP